jgi:periplasmic protein TonB
MSTHHAQPPGLRDRYLGPVLVGLVLGFFIFLMLPISQLLSLGLQDKEKSADISIIEPPDLFETPPPPEDEIQEEDIKELEQEQEPPTLEQLEISMNADVSGLAGGDFTVPAYNLAQEIEELVFEMKDLTVRPRAILQGEPQYPPELKRNGISGEVRLEFWIRANGSTDKIRVLNSTNPAFEEPTIRAVRRWRFEPGERSGEKVNVIARISIPFNVNR